MIVKVILAIFTWASAQQPSVTRVQLAIWSVGSWPYDENQFATPPAHVAGRILPDTRYTQRVRSSAILRGPQHTLVNLPGWCWAEIQQFALVGSSSSLHSEACNALGASDGVIHSRISQEVVCLRATTNSRPFRTGFALRPFTLNPFAVAILRLRSLPCSLLFSSSLFRLLLSVYFAVHLAPLRLHAQDLCKSSPSNKHFCFRELCDSSSTAYHARGTWPLYGSSSTPRLTSRVSAAKAGG